MSERPHAIPIEWLALYYDGELDAQRLEQVAAHLSSCAECQRELAGLKALSRVLAVDRLADNALTSRAVHAAWNEFESRLPERAPNGPALGWLPGIGLLIANVAVQFVAVVSVAVMLAANRLGGMAPSLAWLDRALSDLLLGWIVWLLPAQWSDWGLSLLLIMLSAWLAVFYLAWLAYMWLHRQPPPALQLETAS